MNSIETSIFKGLLFNEEYSRKTLPFLDESYFDGGHKTLLTIYKDLFEKYNKIPTTEAIAITLQKSDINQQEYESVIDVVEEAYNNKEEINTDWLVDETESYCKDKAIFNAVYSSIDILQGGNDKQDKHAIPDILDEALGVSFDTSIGMDFYDDAERRYEIYTADDERVKMPLEVLQEMTNGGLKKKSLSIILAFCVHPSTKVTMRRKLTI